ncbi:hypothetical protein BJ999_004304 [Actinomadura citrea]|uniref:Uncharacterized protein n=1 Tax=Actinomadura citrea TaxID=46158 RepID=A0A7Y9GCH7_9ACTN|nr:hypothetical protein [Actinomadura citrea]GGU01554.1 hypothetical protein GCM10010177_71030 [Actinomadura citrea]
MPWWKRKPRWPVDTDPALAQFRQELIGEFGEDVAYRIRLSRQGAPTECTPTWAPLPSWEAVEHVGHLIGGPRSEITASDIEVQPAGNRWVVLCRPDAGRLR